MITTPPIKIEDLILFILANSGEGMGSEKLNQLAFLLEFTYIFEHGEPLTDAQYLIGAPLQRTEKCIQYQSPAGVGGGALPS